LLLDQLLLVLLGDQLKRLRFDVLHLFCELYLGLVSLLPLHLKLLVLLLDNMLHVIEMRNRGVVITQLF
jgi:hypothetical protein